jgi:hypothetical protein
MTIIFIVAVCLQACLSFFSLSSVSALFISELYVNKHTQQMQNSSGSVNAACLDAQDPTEAYHCIIAPFAEPHVKSPLFLLQSKFDHFQLNAEAGLRCMNPVTGGQSYSPPWAPASGPGGVNCTREDLAAIEAYGLDFWRYFSAAASRPRLDRGCFLTSCIIHGQTSMGAWNHTLVGGTTPAQAFVAWYSDSAASVARNGKWVENCTMPCNANSASCAPWQ